MSRRIEDLQPDIAAKAWAWLKECQARGVDVLVTFTLRTMEDQARLYRNGRTLEAIQEKAAVLEHTYGRPDLAQILLAVGPQSGAVVLTNAGPGQSLHNYGYAFDWVPLMHGVPLWDAKAAHHRDLWLQAAHIGQAVGLEWSGTWTTFAELDHFQLPGAKWQDLIRDTVPRAGSSA